MLSHLFLYLKSRVIRLFEMESDYANLLIIDKFSFIIFCFYSHYYYHLIIIIICLTINICNKDILDYQYM